MASSDNLMTMVEPWAFRSAFSDSWFSDVIFTRETEMLTKVLQQSPSPEPTPVQTSTGSGRTVSNGSENETTTGSNRRCNSISSISKVGVKNNNRKISKRKPRASRRNTTTYITADVDNFRHMVQQVTGVRFGGDGHMSIPPLLKPEPHRARLQPPGCLPTLDTSAFLLDHITAQQQQQQLLDPTSSSAVLHAPPLSSVTASAPPCDGVVDGGGFEFSSFSGFPTLESWKAV